MRLIVTASSASCAPATRGDAPRRPAHAEAGARRPPRPGRVQLRRAPGASRSSVASSSCAPPARSTAGDSRAARRGAFALEFAADGRAAQPPARVQLAIARAIVRLASPAYTFVDESDVAAPREAVFDALAEASSYPEWWKPVYIDVESAGAPAVGKVSRQHFKGRLPYHLHTQSTLTRMEAPHVLEADVVGDLAGRGKWTLTDAARRRTSASTGRSSPTAGCCASSARCCGPRCAGTTRGDRPREGGPRALRAALAARERVSA